jgi:hypothetical protein
MSVSGVFARFAASIAVPVLGLRDRIDTRPSRTRLGSRLRSLPGFQTPPRSIESHCIAYRRPEDPKAEPPLDGSIRDVVIRIDVCRHRHRNMTGPDTPIDDAIALLEQSRQRLIPGLRPQTVSEYPIPPAGHIEPCHRLSSPPRRAVRSQPDHRTHGHQSREAEQHADWQSQSPSPHRTFLNANTPALRLRSRGFSGPMKFDNGWL